MGQSAWTQNSTELPVRSILAISVRLPSKLANLTPVVVQQVERTARNRGGATAFDRGERLIGRITGHLRTGMHLSGWRVNQDLAVNPRLKWGVGVGLVHTLDDGATFLSWGSCSAVQ
jgi:hypothetical protein